MGLSNQSDEEDEEEEGNQKLMEELRRCPPKVKSINEITQLVHAISSEQRTKSLLQTCADKVLMNMNSIHSLRDILERLRSVSRTNGMRCKLDSLDQESSGNETKCHLRSDMFDVEIVLMGDSYGQQRPTVKDVRIQHSGESSRSCPELVKIISDGNFLELSRHLKGLTEMYLSTMSRQMRTKVYMALQSLETDLVKMNKIFNESNKDISLYDEIMMGTVGSLVSRVGGEPSYLTYFISQYDRIGNNGQFLSLKNLTLSDKVGQKAEMSICETKQQCNLPITSLISSQHAIDKHGNARFLDISHHNSMLLQASFVLRLFPPIPILKKVADQISKITDMTVIPQGTDLKPVLELLGKPEKYSKVYFDNHIHTYYLGLNHLLAFTVEKINFSHPHQLTQILKVLRKQSHFNVLILSCLQKGKASNKQCLDQYFDMTCDQDISNFNITFEHPDLSTKSTAFMEFKLTCDGFDGCKLYTSRGDPCLCSDSFATKALQKCSSLPLTMKKVLERSLNNPRKAADPPRLSAPALFSSPQPQLPPTNQNHRVQDLIASVEMKPIITQSPPVSSDYQQESGLFESKPQVERNGKKILENPRLAKLLITSGGASTSGNTQETTVHPQNHPMLMNLLKENDNSDSSLASGNNQQQYSTTNTSLYQQKPTPYNQQQQNLFKTAPPYPSHMPQLQDNFQHQHMPPPPRYPGMQQQTSFSSNQYPIPNSPFSLPSPLHSMEEMTGPHTPVMMSQGMISPGLQSSVLNTSVHGHRISRQNSRSSEGQSPSLGNLDVQFDPTVQYDNMPMDHDSIGMFSPVHKMTPVSISPSHKHVRLQKSNSLQMQADACYHDALMRSASYAGMSSPKAQTPKTPNLISPHDFGPSSSKSDANIFFGSRGSTTFKTPSTSSTTSARRDSILSSDSEKDPFKFDDNKNPRINVMEKKNSNKPDSFDPKWKELVKNSPGLIRALTSESSTPAKKVLKPPYSTPSLESLLTAPVPTSSGSLSSDKILMRQNAVDKNSGQFKPVDGKEGKTLKRKISNKSDDGKGTGPRRRGRPPGGSKDTGTKKRKIEKDNTPIGTDARSSSIVLNVQLSSTGTPISSTTKTRPPPVSSPKEKLPPGLQRYFQTQQELELQTKKKKEKEKEKSVTKKGILTPSISLTGGKIPNKSNNQTSSLQEKTSTASQRCSSFIKSSSTSNTTQKSTRIDDIITNLKAKNTNTSTKPPGGTLLKQNTEKTAPTSKEMKCKPNIVNQKPAQGSSASAALKSLDPKMKQTLSRITEEAAATAKGTKISPGGPARGAKLPPRQPSLPGSKGRVTPTLPSRVSPSLGNQALFSPRKNSSPDITRQSGIVKAIPTTSSNQASQKGSSRPGSADSSSGGSLRSSPAPSSSPTLGYNRKSSEHLQSSKRASPMPGEDKKSTNVQLKISPLKGKISLSDDVDVKLLDSALDNKSSRENDEQVPDPLFLSPKTMVKNTKTANVPAPLSGPSSPERAVWPSPLSPNARITNPGAGGSSGPGNIFD